MRHYIVINYVEFWKNVPRRNEKPLDVVKVETIIHLFNLRRYFKFWFEFLYFDLLILKS